jgi:hypothetical protein
MKSTVFATLTGLGLAGGSLPTNLSGTTTFSSSTLSSSGASSASDYLGGGLTSSYQNVLLNGGNSYNLGSGSSLGFGSGSGLGLGSGYGDGLGFGSGVIVASGGAANGGANGLSSGTALSNIGSGAVLTTANNSGATNIVSGQVITDGNYPKADLNGLYGASSTLVNSNVVAAGVINNAYANTSASTKSIDSLFSRLPSSAELDNLILSADSVAILKTIQAVGTNTSLPCDQRIAYLL